MAITIGGTSGITFNDASAQSGAAVGYSQTWQVVTASRAANTTYTNSTGRPITVSISANAGSGSTTTLYIDNVLIAQAVNANGTVQLSAVIPAGSTYRHTNTYGFSIWAELR